MSGDEHVGWMREALAMVGLERVCDFLHWLTDWDQAEEALTASEVPVGCVFVRDGSIIAKARNRTNELRNV